MEVGRRPEAGRATMGRMRAATIAALIALPALVHAEPSPGAGGDPGTTTSGVVGGTDAPAGKWPDAAAVLFDGFAACTGTLIAPDVAVTAGHCDDASLNAILVGTNSLDRAADGETIAVAQRIVLNGADMTVLKLASASRFAPRAIATGWAALDIQNSARVEIVGYGAIDPNASQFKDELQEVESTITDADCAVMPGCGTNELGAGGSGIDSCNGDSGGPLYLLTDYGDFLVGVTSRAYSNANQPCGEGGIYGRPDQVLAEIEAAAGKPVAHGPEPTADRIEAIRGDAGETVILANDPRSDAHTFELVTSPQFGVAKVREDGAVRVCVNPDAPTGVNADSLVVKVTDQNDPTRAVEARVTIAVGENPPADGDCDVDAFEAAGEDGGGCCDAGRHAGGALPLSLLVLVVLRRRRR